MIYRAAVGAATAYEESRLNLRSQRLLGVLQGSPRIANLRGCLDSDSLHANLRTGRFLILESVWIRKTQTVRERTKFRVSSH